MIHVDRSAVPCPEVLSKDPDSRASRELEKARKFYKNRVKDRGQERFHFTVYRHQEVRDSLTQLFNFKCAYCESRMGATVLADIEQYRPKGGVMESPDHPGYWWLASDWDNLLIACPNCNRSTRTSEGTRSGKANRFPLADEKDRAFREGDEVRESPLLLDPCRDYPEEHLVFTEDGTVVSETPRGQTTITVIGLNRPALVKERYAKLMAVLQHTEVVLELDKILNTLPRSSPDDSALIAQLEKACDRLSEFTEASAEFAGMARQFASPIIRRVTQRKSMKEEVASPSPRTRGLRLTKARKKRAKESMKAYQVAQSSYSLADEEGKEKYRQQSRRIETIDIHNVKAIRDLRLDLTTIPGGTPWLMLLGENATGKSTVLQAIALTLAGAEYFRELAESYGFVPRDFVRYRCKSGTVSVKLSGFPKPHKLTFRDKGVEFTGPLGETAVIRFSRGKITIVGEGWQPQTLLLGYGSTRLLPRTQSSVTYGGDFARINNLFDPFVPLYDAEQWLLSLPRRDFNSTALILKDLLALDDRTRLIAQNGRIQVMDHGSRIPLRQLSDGYQTVVAMTIDILEVARRLWPNLEDAEGIVLLDEIGAHLHPTWKMGIVTSLRRALPGLQFIATTHQPLCLRGLGEGEVVVMQRDEDGAVAPVTGLPSPADFRVDQLLTSEFFGLNSVVDPETEEIFNEYYALLAMDTRSPDETQRLSELKAHLAERRYLGDTLRESLMYEAIDRLLARQKPKERLPLTELKDEAAAEIARIWDEDITPEATAGA